MWYSVVAVLGHPQEVQSWEQLTDTRNQNTANFAWMWQQLSCQSSIRTVASIGRARL